METSVRSTDIYFNERERITLCMGRGTVDEKVMQRNLRKANNRDFSGKTQIKKVK